MLIAAAAADLVATDAADEPDLEVKKFFFCHKTSVLIQLRPCGASVGVSEAAAGPLGEGGGDVHYIQLLFHPTELLSAAAVSQSLEFCSVMEVKEHRRSKRKKEISEKQQQR